MIKRRFCVDIRTVSPMNIMAMSKGTFLPERNKIVRYKTSGGSECGLTITTPIPGIYATARSDEAGAEAEVRSGVVQMPIIPSSTITGGLRRAACSLIEDSLVERKLNVSVAAFNTLSSGSATATLNAATQVTTIKAAALHPFFGLFGGTSFALSSRMVVADAVPVCEEAMGMSLLPSDQPAMLVLPSDMLMPVQIIRKNDAMGKDAQRLIELVGEAEITQYWVSQSEQAVKRKESKAAAVAALAAGESVEKGKKESLQTATAIEAVMPNLNFVLSFEVNAFSEAQFGLFLMSLQRLLRKGQFGGREARGFGRYQVVSASIASQNDKGIWAKLGSVFSDMDTLEFDAELRGASAVAEDWIDTCSVPEIEAFAGADETFFEKAA
ncbi:type IV CRISPR-associated protein Csf2 [Paracidovorax wautersii]|uniref:CRISPR type IV/AFERR-associated protein Csf2 n=1 Tax=Paracidovorax wautersii TaxID=1177982 RepID=A0A1I2HXS9_9BURK|nr:type IV CRISPR-associated protein Csf2 [Paracidovorax wautersii]SFF33141.1 CRISPR type IV/AFERR-associated protein Csf2 [Paracidovorax wautersii]